MTKQLELQLQVPYINIVPQEWTYNLLIPRALRKFQAQSFKILFVMFMLCAISIGTFFFANYIEHAIEEETIEIQAENAQKLSEYNKLKTYSEELRQLSELKNNSAGFTVAEQFAALSAAVISKRCLLTSATFHSDIHQLPDKLIANAKLNLEKLAKVKIDTDNSLKVFGVWEMSIKIPTQGINSAATRNTVITTLQKDVQNIFSPAQAILFDEDVVLKNNDNINMVIVIWGRKGAVSNVQ